MAEENNQHKFRQEFDALPLDQKFSSLFQMEVATLNEAVKYVADTSMKALEKFGDVITDFGTKVEAEAKKATAANEPPAAESEPKPKAKPASKRKPAAAKE